MGGTPAAVKDKTLPQLVGSDIVGRGVVHLHIGLHILLCFSCVYPKLTQLTKRLAYLSSLQNSTKMENTSIVHIIMRLSEP